GQVELVILNLVVNARDAMPNGGRIAIETANANLDAEYARTHLGAHPGSYVMLSVSDSGTGMDPETRARIFEPFFTTKEAGKGTGLGLSIVYGIVKQSGGFIWCDSEAGVGTVFKIYFPRAAGESAGRPAPEQLRIRGGDETVLLVEDEGGVRRMVRDMLSRHGYTVLEAADGAAAHSLLRESSQAVHLLLTDVVMPDLSGRALAESLQALRPGLKVLFMSGYTDESILRRHLIEPEYFLQKPFSPDILAVKVREVLERA
ncbi:MAG: response regulator, partial [Acidobacteria bacterium]|nr:response regulator [Acidobacteriota bacterium]